MPIIAGRASAAYGAGFAAITAAPYLGPFGAYDALATITVPSGGSASVTFSGIPTGYKHLQIRTINQNNRSTYTTSDNFMRLNNDSGNNYAWHALATSAAAGSNAVDAGSGTTAAGIYPFTTSSGVAGSTYGAAIIDLLDYQSTQNKTVRILSGADTNGVTASYQGFAEFGSGLYISSNPITSVTILPYFGSLFNQNSQFALYGVK